MSLAAALRVADRELVAFVGGGGKTSLLLQLADELAERAPVLITTTTKLGIDQPGDRPVCWSVDEAAAMLSDQPDRPVCLFAGADGSKLGGYVPEDVDVLYRGQMAPYVLVEADGSRRRPLKAPAAHEPVVPGEASLVVVVVGWDAVGATYAEAAHRPVDAVRLTGAGVGDVITVEAVARLLTHPEGGLRGIPEPARVIVAVTKVERGQAAEADDLRSLIVRSGRVDDVLLIPHTAGRTRHH